MASISLKIYKLLVVSYHSQIQHYKELIGEQRRRIYCHAAYIGLCKKQTKKKKPEQMNAFFRLCCFRELFDLRYVSQAYVRLF